jgi:hypothetical protein
VRKECLWTKKKSARVRLWKRRKAEKSKTRLSRLAWKSRKHRGIPTLPQPRRREINQNRTFHLLQKPDILICYQHPTNRRVWPLYSLQLRVLRLGLLQDGAYNYIHVAFSFLENPREKQWNLESFASEKGRRYGRLVPASSCWIARSRCRITKRSNVHL